MDSRNIQGVALILAIFSIIAGYAYELNVMYNQRYYNSVIFPFFEKSDQQFVGKSSISFYECECGK